MALAVFNHVFLLILILSLLYLLCGKNMESVLWYQWSWKLKFAVPVLNKESGKNRQVQ